MSLEDLITERPASGPVRYGYARVSTSDQDPQRQIDQLLRDGIEPAFIVSEKVSGMKPRPKLAAMMAELQRGDELHVTKLDRLCRDRRETTNTAADLEARGIILVFDGNKYDPSTAMGKYWFDQMASIGQLERDQLAERTRDALASLRAAGKHLGRPAALSSEQELILIPLIQQGFLASELMAITGVSRSTINRLQRKVRNLEADSADPSRVRERRLIEAQVANELQAERAKTLKGAQRKIDALRPKGERDSS